MPLILKNKLSSIWLEVEFTLKFIFFSIHIFLTGAQKNLTIKKGSLRNLWKVLFLKSNQTITLEWSKTKRMLDRRSIDKRTSREAFACTKSNSSSQVTIIAAPHTQTHRLAPFCFCNMESKAAKKTEITLQCYTATIGSVQAKASPWKALTFTLQRFSIEHFILMHLFLVYQPPTPPLPFTSVASYYVNCMKSPCLDKALLWVPETGGKQQLKGSCLLPCWWNFH